MNFKRDVLAILGATTGGALAYYAFIWIVEQGFYAMILPGVFVGLGARFARSRNAAIPVLCALGTLALSLFLEWKMFPFIADNRLKYFLTHLDSLRPVTWIMIAAGVFLAFWIPFRKTHR